MAHHESHGLTDASEAYQNAADIERFKAFQMVNEMICHASMDAVVIVDRM